MIKLFVAGLLVFLISCVQAPTKITEEVGGADSSETVLVDVRAYFQYVSYHVSGSVSLNTQDYLILTGVEKDPAKRKRKFDPDLEQTIERLSRRGIAPGRKIILIYDENSEIEAYKWMWLMKQLGLRKTEMQAFQSYIEKNKPLRPRAEPGTAVPWKVANRDFIIKEAEFCFAEWSPATCQGD